MSVPFQARGAWTALVTPFTAGGEFDRAAYARLVNFQVEQGIHGLVPCGTTGESPTLSWEEQGAAVDLAVAGAKGKLGVLAGTGSNSTSEAIHGSLDARERGASGVLLVDCYYNGPSSLELRTEYYERILGDVPELPIVPYVIPGRTGCALGAEDLAILHRQDPKRVPAVKSATGDFERMRRDRECAGSDLGILSGDDDLTLRMMRDPGVAGSGVISVMANIAPGAVSGMVAAQLKGATEAASELEQALAPLFRLVVTKAKSERKIPGGGTFEVEDRFRNPTPVKTMMAGLGMIEGTFRAPLGRMTAPAVAACRAAIREVWERRPDVLRPIETAFGVSIAKRLADDSIWSKLTR
jgi:4-hydroxy-tetrahydrodipicolinate synthase